MDGGLIVLLLLPQLPTQLLLSLLDPPDGEVTLLCLHDRKQALTLGPCHRPGTGRQGFRGR